MLTDHLLVLKTRFVSHTKSVGYPCISYPLNGGRLHLEDIEAMCSIRVEQKRICFDVIVSEPADFAWWQAFFGKEHRADTFVVLLEGQHQVSWQHK